MKPARRFLLDSDTFIQAKRRHYAFDICPGYWTAILRLHSLRLVSSIDRVRAELIGYGDELSDWVKDRAPPQFFKKTQDRAVIQQYTALGRWVEGQGQYSEEATQRFLSGADPWLIAYAMVSAETVVTYEEHRPDAKNTVPIPNVCIHFGVGCIDPFQMLRELGVRFRSSRIKGE